MSDKIHPNKKEPIIYESAEYKYNQEHAVSFLLAIPERYRVERAADSIAYWQTRYATLKSEIKKLLEEL